LLLAAPDLLLAALDLFLAALDLFLAALILLLAGKILLFAKEFFRGAGGWCDAEGEPEVAEAALGKAILFAANSYSREWFILQKSGEIKQIFNAGFFVIVPRIKFCGFQLAEKMGFCG
jgi:hypothetical protein